MSMSMSGGPSRCGRQEPLEQQPERHRVGGRDAERVAHRRVGGAAPTLAEDVRPPAELDEVPHDEEVAGEPEVLDDVELVVDRAPRPGAQRQVLVRCRALAVAAAATVLGDLAQVLHLGQRLAVGLGARERRQVRRDERQVERRRPADLGGPLDDARVAGEAAGLLGARAQVGAGGGRQPRVELGEAAAGPHGGEGGGQPALRRRGVVDVVGGDALDAVAVRRARRGRRCGPSRAGRRGPTARPARGRARTPRSAAAARGGRPPGRRSTSAAGTAPLRQPVSAHASPAMSSATSASVNCGAPFSPARCPRLSVRARRP